MTVSGPRKMEGKPIVDAARTVLISVRTSDIKYAVGKAPDACAAAIACVRQLTDAISARVHPGRTYIEYDDRWVRYMTPPDLRKEIVEFDDGIGFTPGVYELKAVPPSMTQDQRRPKSRQRYHAGKAKGHKAKKRHKTIGSIRERPHFTPEALPPTMTAIPTQQETK